MPPLMSPYQLHLAKWRHCTLCPLHKTRCKTALLRGAKLPCQILFVGEGPGQSEDACGRPFVQGAPAGRMLQSWINAAGITDYAITNLIACIPKDDTGQKVTVPPAFAVKACAPRLQQVVALAKPRMVVYVGKEAAKHFKKSVPDYKGATCEITHPASILRANIAQQSLAQQRCVATLLDAALLLEEES